MLLSFCAPSALILTLSRRPCSFGMVHANHARARRRPLETMSVGHRAAGLWALCNLGVHFNSRPNIGPELGTLVYPLCTQNKGGRPSISKPWFCMLSACTLPVQSRHHLHADAGPAPSRAGTMPDVDPAILGAQAFRLFQFTSCGVLGVTPRTSSNLGISVHVKFPGSLVLQSTAQEWDAAVSALVRCAWADPLSSLPGPFTEPLFFAGTGLAESMP